MGIGGVAKNASSLGTQSPDVPRDPRIRHYDSAGHGGKISDGQCNEGIWRSRVECIPATAAASVRRRCTRNAPRRRTSQRSGLRHIRFRIYIFPQAAFGQDLLLLFRCMPDETCGLTALVLGQKADFLGQVLRAN